MSDDIIQAIKECPMVKNIPTGVSSLLKELTKQEVDIDELIDLLEKFPVVCIRLIMVANSAWAAPRAEITNVKRACMQLGLNTVKSISIALLVSQQFNAQHCKGFSEKTFWLSSLVAADLMFLIQKHTEATDTDSSTAYLVGLIHNLGLLAIADIAPEKLSQAFLLSDNSVQPFSQALEKVLGITYLEVTQVILQNWGLPSNLSDAYYGSSDASSYRKLLSAVMTIKNCLDLTMEPITALEDSDDEDLMVQHVIEQSEHYRELCAMYCR